MKFPLEPPWSTLLMMLSLGAMAYLGMRIERHRWSTKLRTFNEGDTEEDDFEPPERPLHFLLLRLRVWWVRRWARIKDRIYCMRHNLVPVPPGSVQIVEFLVEDENQLTEPVPSEIFTPPEAFCPRLSLPIVQPGINIRLSFRNNSKFPLPVQAMAMCRMPGISGMVPLPFPPLELLPEGRGETTAQPVRAVQIERLLLSVPKHLPRTK